MAKMAQAGTGNEKALKQLIDSGDKEFAMIAAKIRSVKTAIEERNNDPHWFDRE